MGGNAGMDAGGGHMADAKSLVEVQSARPALPIAAESPTASGTRRPPERERAARPNTTSPLALGAFRNIMLACL